jgi:hypothetical protein
MDGFQTDPQVLVIGATNRLQALDTALLRPGRFDRVVTLALPDEAGRFHILSVHCRHASVDEPKEVMTPPPDCPAPPRKPTLPFHSPSIAPTSGRCTGGIQASISQRKSLVPVAPRLLIRPNSTCSAELHHLLPSAPPNEAYIARLVSVLL